MSADARRSTRAAHGQTVRPETVTEKSFMESVTGIINEVVPTSYSSAPTGVDHRETVQWARFEHCDINDVCLYTDSMEANGNVAPLILAIGYTTGVQVWLLQGNGEAQEVLSWRQGVVRDARLLPSPEHGAEDLYAQKRPLMAVCDATGTETHFCSVGLISLRTGEQVKSVKFKSAITAILASNRVMVVTFPGKLAVFDAGTFEDRFSVTTCYPSPGISDNPVALGHRWLAYGEKRLSSHLQSQGGMSDTASHSYTASVLHAAKSISKGIRELGEGLASTLAGGRYAPPPPPPVSSAASGAPHPGLVTVLDVLTTGRGGAEADRGVVAHFQAHAGPVVQLCFDASGTLLLTADKAGNSFHVFRVQPHPQRTGLATVLHLYTLYRGDTTAKVLDMSFSLDARWVAVATHRGTAHLFPICPYGGAISTRTHCGPRVVNKLSRFHRSAGLQDTVCRSGRNSPLSPRAREPSGGSRAAGAPPAPVLVPPLAQLRQPLLTQLTAATGGPPPRHSPGSRHSTAEEPSHVRVVSTFAPSRGWLMGPTASGATGAAARDRRHWDALYVMANNGSLIEYHVEPRPASVCKERVPDDAPVEVAVHAHAQWSLCRQTVWPEVRPPLATGSALLVQPSSPTPAAPSAGAENWVSQVEILSHSGPHRRLWMGPQFSFRPFSDSGHGGVTETRDLLSAARSSPVNMPAQLATHSIECGSANSYEQSPRLIDGLDADSDPLESQLCQRIADAMSDLGGPATQHEHSLAARRRRHRSGSARSTASSGSAPEGRGYSPLDFSEYERDDAAADERHCAAGSRGRARGSSSGGSPPRQYERDSPEPPAGHHSPMHRYGDERPVSPEVGVRRDSDSDYEPRQAARSGGDSSDGEVDTSDNPFSAACRRSSPAVVSYNPHLLDEPVPDRDSGPSEPDEPPPPLPPPPPPARRSASRSESASSQRRVWRADPAPASEDDSSPAATAHSSADASEAEDFPPHRSEREEFLLARERHSGDEEAESAGGRSVARQASRGFGDASTGGELAFVGAEQEREQFEFEREQESGWGEDILCPDVTADSSSISASDRERADKTSDEETRPTPVTKRRGKKKRR